MFPEDEGPVRKTLTTTASHRAVIKDPMQHLIPPELRTINLHGSSNYA